MFVHKRTSLPITHANVKHAAGCSARSLTGAVSGSLAANVPRATMGTMGGVLALATLIAAVPCRADGPTFDATINPQPNAALSLAAHPQAKTDMFLSRALSAQPQSGWTNVIAHLDGGVTPAREAQMRVLGAQSYRHLDVIHSVAMRVPTRNLAALAALPFVQHLSADVAVKKNDEYTTQASGAPTAWAAPYNLSGVRVGVAVVDSGIHEQHPDLSVPVLDPKGKLSTQGDRVVASVNFVDSANDPSPTVGDRPSPLAWDPTKDLTLPSSNADDKCGHGTHIAGIIVGNAYQSSGATYTHHYSGVAPKAQLINVRVLNSYGQSDVSTVAAGIQWVINSVTTPDTLGRKNPYNIRVINLSVGHPVGDYYANDPLCQMVEAAYKAGIVVVCTAGNDGRANDTLPDTPAPDNEGYGTAYGSINSPGNDPYVITVGAMKQMDANRANDHIATYSGRGPARLDLTLKPDIIAPGNHIVSLNVTGSYLDLNYNAQTNVLHNEYINKGDAKPSKDYIRLSGTSMAAPVVAGAAALLLQADPTLTPDTIKARLMFAADKWADPDGNGDACTYGAGYLNIPAALQNRVVASQPAMSPNLVIDDQGNITINMDKALWGTKAIWGTGITDTRALWGTRAVWGTNINTLNATRALWGTSVWSDRAIWGTSVSQADFSKKVIQGE